MTGIIRLLSVAAAVVGLALPIVAGVAFAQDDDEELLRAIVSGSEKRVALIIGNGNYKKTARLANPRNDAEDVAAALKRSGFRVMLGLDLDKPGMEEIGIRFARAVREADVALFYYSGHAVQFAGSNYLLPVEAELLDVPDLRRLIRVDDIVADLEQARNLRILVLDACRDNPLAAELKRLIGSERSSLVTRGLAKIQTPFGMIVSYATQAGTTASDGGGRNSPYTTAFLKHIETQQEIGRIFRRIASDVYAATGKQQLPELSLSFLGEYYLHGRAEPVQTATSVPADSCALAAEHWRSAEAIGTRAAFEDHLARFPGCAFAGLAQARLDGKQVAALARSPDPPSRGETVRSPVDSKGGTGVVRERATLYEEDSSPGGRQYHGFATWRTESIPSGPGRPQELALVADVEIPERKIALTLTLRRNSEAALPASHTVEISFKQNQGGSGDVADVPGVLTKRDEQSRGTPLSGTAVKVTDGFFLIALSAVDADRERNVRNLSQQPWLDIPFTYRDKRRAILAVERGASGERAMAEAFAMWSRTAKR